METNTQCELTILLGEDDPGHARLIQKNLRRAKVSDNIVAVDNGKRAVDYLFGEGEYEGQSISYPLVVLLDLNMPVMDGYQVLEAIKGDERTRQIPVIVLTTTDDPREVSRCYRLGCNLYVTKPIEYAQFTETIGTLGAFLSIVAFPDGKA